MAAGLGFKDFQTGEVLTAADVDGYLMQGVWVFASAAARDAAVTSPQEGNFAYLKDTNVTTYYTGSAWANLDTTGMTNPMTTTGDIIYSSPGSTPVRLGIGTANQVLTVNSGATAPEWKTPAAGGGGKVLQVVSATKDTAFSTTSTSFTDVTGLSVSITPSSATSKVLVMMTAQISGGDTGRSLRGRLMRGATAIAVGTSGRTYMSRPTNPDEINSMAVTFLDSPATTSATTYNTQILTTNGSLAVYVNRNEASADEYFSTITVMEIGA